MTINLIFKIAAVGILVSILCQVLKHSGREEQAFLTSLAGLCWYCSGSCRIFMICLNPSRIYFHYKGKGLYVVKKCILYRHGRWNA